MTGDVPGIILDECQVGKVGMLLDVAAGSDIARADFNPDRLETHAGKLDGEPALQAAEVGEAKAAFVAWKDEIETAPGREKPGVGSHRQSVLGPGVDAIVQKNVVGGE